VGASLDAGAQALLTTPGAAKWYRSEGPRACQALHFSLLGNAVLEWLPRENILFDGSRISMSVDVALAADSRYFGWEILCFGRRASGERWRFGTLEMRTRIRRAGRVLWSELANVDAQSSFANSTAGLSGSTVSGTFLVAGYPIESELLRACRALPTSAAARTGVTRVPEVLIARYLGDSSEEALQYFTALWALVRPALAAKVACLPRVWAC
jgi:urease accessory protein